MDVSEIDFAALGIADNDQGFGTGGMASTSSSGKKKAKSSKSKKKGGHRRAHRRSGHSHNNSSSNLDFLNELDPVELGAKKPSTRGLRNHANQMPVSYEQPAWMQYKQRVGESVAKKASRRSGAQVYEGKTGGRMSPKRSSGALVSGETKVGTPRDRIRSSVGAGAGAGESKKSVGGSHAAGAFVSGLAVGGIAAAASSTAGSTTPRGAATPRGGSTASAASPSRGKKTRRKQKHRQKHKSDKTKSTGRLKSQTLPKKAAAAFPSINGMRSVASLLSGAKAQQQSLDTMRAVGVTKKQHEKPVSMKKTYAADRTSSTGGAAFLKQLSPSRTGRERPVKKAITGFT